MLSLHKTCEPHREWTEGTYRVWEEVSYGDAPHQETVNFSNIITIENSISHISIIHTYMV